MVGNDVYIGNDVIILPGVNIGNKVVIGAGAVVTKDIPDNSVAVGVPARVIESADEYFEKNSARVASPWTPERSGKRQGFDGVLRVRGKQ